MSISQTLAAGRDQLTIAQADLFYNAQELPFNPKPNGPEDVQNKMSTGLDLGWLIFIALIFIGAGAMIVSVILKKSEGASENVTTNVARVGMGIIAFASLGSIIRGLM